MENDKYKFKLDVVKWKNDLYNVLQAREEGRKIWEQYLQDLRDGKSVKYQVCHEERWAESLTRLYSIKAHAKGRLHRTRARFTAYEWKRLGHDTPGWQEFTKNNGTIVMTLAIQDQATYLGDSWKEYVKKVELSEFELAEFNSLK